MSSTEIVAAIDPGLANCGVLIWDGRRIIAARTFTSGGDGYRTDFDLAYQRSRATADDVAEYLLAYHVERAVVEKYRDIPGDLRKARNRWTTPLAIGVLLSRIDVDGRTIIFQDPEYVMTAYSQAKSLWKAGRHGILPGDELITNDHLRSAGCHLLSYTARS